MPFGVTACLRGLLKSEKCVTIESVSCVNTEVHAGCFTSDLVPFLNIYSDSIYSSLDTVGSSSLTHVLYCVYKEDVA